jgi:REP element-mobilizing transposase RayT
MTTPRSEILTPEVPTYYHCVSRCVRRAFLCGWCKLLNKNFDHRKEWVRRRLSLLVETFAIELVAYAAMSNHLHTLIQTRPDVALSWTPTEVATRWLRLFPNARFNCDNLSSEHPAIKRITDSPTLVELYRSRLGSISWFNRCLNEHIARQANQEDDCKGRFWEGRFKCSRIDSLGGVLACSVYVDLNPVRAGLAETPETSDFTSIQDRIAEVKHRTLHSGDKKTGVLPQLPNTPKLAPIEDFTAGKMTSTQYIELVDNTGRMHRRDKRGFISDELVDILIRLNLRESNWTATVTGFGRLFSRVVGDRASLSSAIRGANKKWFKGKKGADFVFGTHNPVPNQPLTC